jgi:hypothetical protein
MMNNASDHAKDVFLIVVTMGFISLVWLGAVVVTSILYAESLTKGRSAKEE